MAGLGQAGPDDMHPRWHRRLVQQLGLAEDQRVRREALARPLAVRALAHGDLRARGDPQLLPRGVHLAQGVVLPHEAAQLARLLVAHARAARRCAREEVRRVHDHRGDLPALRPELHELHRVVEHDEAWPQPRQGGEHRAQQLRVLPRAVADPHDLLHQCEGAAPESPGARRDACPINLSDEVVALGDGMQLQAGALQLHRAQLSCHAWSADEEVDRVAAAGHVGRQLHSHTHVPLQRDGDEGDALVGVRLLHSSERL
mmetsp:Transcript_51214/g.163979  ORF Transcript_51214/g.163979 Transcript_51214/m.163979 type:complete len:258 (+) Transcript_51214:768-1541(+)